MSGVYREEEIPSSISNLEVKLFIADDTAPFRCGKLGQRQAILYKELLPTLCLLLENLALLFTSMFFSICLVFIKFISSFILYKNLLF